MDNKRAGEVTFRVMVDGVVDHHEIGRLYCLSTGALFTTRSLSHIVQTIESVLDSENLIKRTYSLRRFSLENQHEPESVAMSETNSGQSLSGDLATFLVNIKFRQNGTFQGSLQWVDEDRKVNFRSDFEMLKLIYDALEQYHGGESISWDDDKAE